MNDAATALARMRQLAEARAPFVHQGRTPAGLDCVGALCYALCYDGPVPDYPRDPVNGELDKALRAVLGEPVAARTCTTEPPLPLSALRPGDIVSMQYAGPERHVAMIGNHPHAAGALTVIHTDAMVGHVVEHTLDTKWQRRIVKAWRL